MPNINYPAQTLNAAVNLTIEDANIHHRVINGSDTEEITVDDGNIPSIRKMQKDNFYFIDPIDWVQGGAITAFNQLVKFTDGTLWAAPEARTTNPVLMGVSPVGDALWQTQLYGASLQQIARSLNVSDVNVLRGVAGQVITAATLYIYNQVGQTTYGIPAGVGAGEVIVSVVGNQLETDVSSPAKYTLIAVMTRNSFDTVADMLSNSSTFKIGDELKTKGRNSIGDGGAAKYLVIADATHTDGIDGRHESYDYFQITGAQISISHNGVVFPEQFGWVGDWDGLTGTDNTLAINNMISYCVPFDYDTSVAITRANLGNVRAKIVGGFGKARATDSVLINPFMQWEGIKKGAFDGKQGGSLIVGDFDSDVKYIADTAPMISGGARPLGALYNRTDFDGGVITGCMGWKISSVSFDAATNRTIKGAFNRQGGIQSTLEDCSLGGNGDSSGNCYEGLKNSVCWGGSVTNNHILGTAYAIRNDQDVTTDYQNNNYLTITGTPPSSVDYDYVVWPSASLQDNTACIVNRFADPHMSNNTHEKGQLGIQSLSGAMIKDTGGYFEGITKYLYACHTVNLDATPKWADCPAAELLWLDGGSTTIAKINIVATSYLTVAGFGIVSSFVKGAYITGATRAINLPFNNGFYLTDIEFNGELHIYVDNAGDDLNSGYNLINAVLTLQGALERCQRGVKNIIHLTDAQTIATKFQLFDGTITNRVLSGMEIEIVGAATISVSNSSQQTYCIPLRDCNLYIKGPSIDLSGAGTGDYASFIRPKGSINCKISGGSITGTAGSIFGTQFGITGHAAITLDTVTLGAGVVFTENGGEAKSFTWLESSRSITDNGAVVGSGSDGKIFSKIFP